MTPPRVHLRRFSCILSATKGTFGCYSVALGWVLLLLLFAPLACQERQRRIAPAPLPLVEEVPIAEESEPPILKDEALTLANLAQLQKAEQPVLYLVPVKSSLPVAPGSAHAGPTDSSLRWLMSFRQGKKLGDWKVLPLDFQRQVELFQRTWKRHPQSGKAPIQSVIAYRDDMALEEIGAMHEVLKGTCKNLEINYYQAYLSKTKELDFELPDDLEGLEQAH